MRGRQEHPSRRAGRLFGPLAAGVVALAACGGANSAAVPPSGAPPPSTTSTPSTPAPGASRGDGPGPTVTAWVTHVLLEEYPQACSLMALGDRPSAAPADGCDEPSMRALTSFHDAWAKPGVPLPPEAEVTVERITARAGTARVPGSAVRVGEQTLDDLVLVGATPGAAASLDIVVDRGSAGWRVSDVAFDASVGQTQAPPTS